MRMIRVLASVAIAILGSALWINKPTVMAAPPAPPTLAQIADRVALLEKEMKVLETIAFTPEAMHSYVRREAKTLAGDDADALILAVTEAENAKSPEGMKAAYKKAKEIIHQHKKAHGEACPSYCDDQYNQCTDTPTACFGRYIVCCKG
jgi:hypothetical protein